MGIGIFAVFISVFYLPGFAMLGYALWTARQSTRAAAWRTTPAKINRLYVLDSSANDSTTYEVKVQYTYTVDGMAYEGSRLAFGYAGSRERAAHEEIHRKLREAEVVDVRYDPAEPSVSCLSFGLHRSIWFHLAFAVMWLLVGSGITFWFWLFSGPDAVLLKNLSMR